MPIPGNWRLFYDWGCDGSYGSTTMTFNADGTWTNGQGYKGTWAGVAGMVTFQFANSTTTYSGVVASLSVTGIQSTFTGLNGCFYLLGAGAPTALLEQQPEGHRDSSGTA